MPLLTGGAGVLARSVALNIAFLSVTRATQAIDPAGNAAAAHTIAMQAWQLGGVVLFALSSVAAVLVQSLAMNAPKEEGGGARAPRASRTVCWAGGCVPAWRWLSSNWRCLYSTCFSPVASIREAARAPAAIGAALQLLNGVTFVAEGIMQGHQAGLLSARAIRRRRGWVGAVVADLRVDLVGRLVFLRGLQRDSVRGAFATDHSLPPVHWGRGRGRRRISSVFFVSYLGSCRCERSYFKRARGDRDSAAGCDLEQLAAWARASGVNLGVCSGLARASRPRAGSPRPGRRYPGARSHPELRCSLNGRP